ncbi:UNVERIFIED_CONTAM: hypothetical protein GTU68_058896 [Idotea baltica]|nr:hypothetical protein [Idotea baltica]
MLVTAEYDSTSTFDELFDEDGHARIALIGERLNAIPQESLRARQAAAAQRLLERGITFTVYGHNDGTEKVWPFDIIPRVIRNNEWRTMESGLQQRIRALNLFLDDVYGKQRIIDEGVIPRELIETSACYQPKLAGSRPSKGVWTHIVGTDLVRDADGSIYVLEDNARCPSGVSYVLENREAMKRVLPEVFEGSRIASVEAYPERLLETLIDVAPENIDKPTAVLLTPGHYNSAYFEHCFLAQRMGIELVSGADLVIQDDVVWMKTTRGLRRVDVIYRRIDDEFLDPEFFRKDSMLGVPGLMKAYFAGNVTLANAPGNGIADDKAVYAYVPDMIKFYLSEDPILKNVPTFVCSRADECQHVLDNLDKMVTKPVNESGGYGIVLGPNASRAELEASAAAIKADPRNYVAQPMLNLSTVPTITDKGLAPRHCDLRPFILYGNDIFVLPGGLTRVALIEGSMIVNSSQGGGSKDTWVLND